MLMNHTTADDDKDPFFLIFYVDLHTSIRKFTN